MQRDVLSSMLALILSFCALTSLAAAEETLFEFRADFDVAQVVTQDARAALVSNNALRIETGHKNEWPGIKLKAPNGSWDLSDFRHLAFDLHNPGDKEISIGCRIDSPDEEGKSDSCQEIFTLAAGERKTCLLAIGRRMPAGLAKKLYGMRGYPGGMTPDKGIDAARVTQILVFVSRPKEDRAFELGAIRATGQSTAGHIMRLGDKLFPFIDEYGQFIHADWPGKTHSEADLAEAKQREAADLAAQPGPSDWNQYGGWAAGPQLEATGFFRVEKVKGKWWLVDPEGRLFWSHGIDCVRDGNATTPISDRENYFRGLPAKDSPFGVFYGHAGWAPHGYYQGKEYDTFNFTGANLLRKYGPEWKSQFAELCHRRIRSWGLNTIGNWSDPAIAAMGKTVYVATVGSGGRRIEGSEGYWGKFPDPFDPSFREALDRRMAGERGKTADDPWCLGYFVDNELGWGDELSLALGALQSPADQAAKQAFIADLKAKYEAIEKLNAAWGTEHASWDALMASRTAPDKTKARPDLEAFYTRVAEEYFRNCREAVKQVSPNHLYLGCRFAWVNDRAVRASAGYCDVIGFNKYSYSIADFTLPERIDKPAIVGEFHFGALDRGMFHTGLRPVADQNARAAAYKSYVLGALDNPHWVGTHWFQWGDQATTGRGDGENYQIGFMDVCDTPYPETIQASREVGAALYRTRYEGGKP